MKLKDLNIAQQKSVIGLLEMFRIRDLQYLGKIALGSQIAQRVNMLGRDGQRFVDDIYNQIPQDQPPDASELKRELLVAFLKDLCRTVLRTRGYDIIGAGNTGLDELARELFELSSLKAD
jgi:hypothetical protein